MPTPAETNAEINKRLKDTAGGGQSVNNRAKSARQSNFITQLEGLNGRRNKVFEDSVARNSDGTPMIDTDGSFVFKDKASADKFDKLNEIAWSTMKDYGFDTTKDETGKTIQREDYGTPEFIQNAVDKLKSGEVSPTGEIDTIISTVIPEMKAAGLMAGGVGLGGLFAKRMARKASQEAIAAGSENILNQSVSKAVGRGVDYLDSFIPRKAVTKTTPANTTAFIDSAIDRSLVPSMPPKPLQLPYSPGSMPMSEAEIAAAQRGMSASGPPKYADNIIQDTLRGAPRSIEMPAPAGQWPTNRLLEHKPLTQDINPESARQLLAQRLWMEGIPSQGIPPRTFKLMPDGNIVMDAALPPAPLGLPSPSNMGHAPIPGWFQNR